MGEGKERGKKEEGDTERLSSSPLHVHSRVGRGGRGVPLAKVFFSVTRERERERERERANISLISFLFYCLIYYIIFYIKNHFNDFNLKKFLKNSKKPKNVNSLYIYK